MGQTESRKLKRSKKSLVFPKASPEFMETFPNTDNKGKEGSTGKKHAQSKGVAMSFGFRRKQAPQAATVVPRVDLGTTKAEEQLHLPRRAVIVGKQSPSVNENEAVRNDANRFGFRVKRPQDAASQPCGYRQQPRAGRYTLQSTELPQLEPVRVIESKTEKTIINTRRKTANDRQQYCESGLGCESDAFSKCSIKNNNENVYAARHSPTANRNYRLAPADNETGNNNNAKHQKVAEAPVPEPDIQKTFFKLKLDEISKHDSQSDLWDNAGEAMALDLNQLSCRSHKRSNLCSGAVSPPLCQRLLATPPALDASPANDDLSFVTVAEASVTGMLLDDEILSPIESLSCSESAENTRTSPSKDVDEKSPGSPTNASSMSLAEEKDFLIDDEIEDQPALTFKAAPGNDDDDDEPISLDVFKYDYDKDSLRRHLMKAHRKAKAPDASPSSLKTRRLFPKSTTGSVDSLSSCESIASDDFIMDYDSSHTNDPNDLHHRAGEKTAARAHDPSPRESPWLERETDYPPFATRRPEPRYAPDSSDTLNYNLNNGFTLNLNVKQSPTIQKDVRDIKRLLVKLKMVLNDSDAQNPFRDVLLNLSGQQDAPDDRTNLAEKELADLRRQVLFLQVQLENKEETLASLQKRIADLSAQNSDKTGHGGDARPAARMHCNAATQTKRVAA